LPLDVRHPWLQKAYDCLAAAVALDGLALVEIGLAAIGRADQPMIEG
jgi:hypothetical protein